MDKYSLSQTPGSKKKAPAKKKLKTPKSRQTKSVDPKLALIAAVVVLVLILGGIVWARYFRGSEAPVATSAAEVKKQRADETGEVKAETFDGVTGAISNKNTTDLSKYYAKNVKVVILGKSINQTVSSGLVGNYVNNPLNAAQTPWDWHVSPQDLAAWQQGPYSEYFVGNVIVGISADNTVIVIHIDDNGDIDSIFIAPVGDLVNPPASDTSNPTTTPTDSSTPPATTTDPATTDVAD
ncbi:MAG: hypothetical protein ABIQ89_00345 [Candidatus Saccharimonadales bacterium]